jgi:hypothetical protein
MKLLKNITLKLLLLAIALPAVVVAQPTQKQIDKSCERFLSSLGEVNLETKAVYSMAYQEGFIAGELMGTQKINHEMMQRVAEINVAKGNIEQITVEQARMAGLIAGIYSRLGKVEGQLKDPKLKVGFNVGIFNAQVSNISLDFKAAAACGVSGSAMIAPGYYTDMSALKTTGACLIGIGSVIAAYKLLNSETVKHGITNPRETAKTAWEFIKTHKGKIGVGAGALATTGLAYLAYNDMLPSLAQ